MTIDNKEDAFALITEAMLQLNRISQGYNEALYAKKVPKSYLVLYKNYLENLRSALDYTAKNLFDRYGKSKYTNPHVYFPYVPNINMSMKEYESKTLFERKLPGVESSRPDIKDFILKFSQYEDGFRWFIDFMQITNQKKHVQLVPQEVKDDVVLDAPGINIRADSIVLGDTGVIRTDAGDISGPMNVIPGQNIVTSTGEIITPHRLRSLTIKGYFSAGEALEFAEHCGKVIPDVVDRLMREPPNLK